VITLHTLVIPENQTLFSRYPELNDIWEVPSLQAEARESYERYGLVEYKFEKKGEIFSINEDNVPIGIIGWFEYGEFPDVLRLRYYGIVPSRRRRHYGEQAMNIFLTYLSQHAPSQYIFLAESVTLSRSIAPAIIAHFKRMGFVEFDDPNYGSNADCGKTQSLRIRIPGR
jgi:hypothetical protein